MKNVRLVSLIATSIIILIIIYTYISRTDHYKCSEWSDALYPNSGDIDKCKKELNIYKTLSTDRVSDYSNPTEWGLCKSSSCNKEGTQTRIRICNHNNKYKCDGDLIKQEKRKCNNVVYAKNNLLSVTPFNHSSTKLCNNQANWSDWSPWSEECHKVNENDNCGIDGIQSRIRLCNNPYPSVDESGRPESECIGGNGKMFAVSLQNINDSNDSNKILQNISESDINKSRQNAINISGLPSLSLKNWPPNINRINNSMYVNTVVEKETKSCPRPCNPVNGGVSEWSEWSKCSAVNCESKGSRRRTRTCSNPVPSQGGLPCTDPLEQIEECELPCQIHGGWGNWSDWNNCDAECDGKGTQTRTRSCNNPSPKHGGRYCKGESSESRQCDGEPCPKIDGGWSDWSEWSKCTTQSDGSCKKRKTRDCNNPQPSNGGTSCTGKPYEEISCQTSECNS